MFISWTTSIFSGYLIIVDEPCKIKIGSFTVDTRVHPLSSQLINFLRISANFGHKNDFDLIHKISALFMKYYLLSDKFYPPYIDFFS